MSSNPRVQFPPAPRAQAPSRPSNALHEVAGAIGTVVGAPGQAVALLNEGFATLTNSISQMLPCFPAATLGSMALGAPHAHTLHPPSGPPPVPPTPLPPFGPIMFGTCVSVLINGKPAARCGDLGLGPTCCGIPPIYEVFTGSSKVFIGGARAARALDVTYHCKPVPPAGAAARGAAAALKTAMKAAMIAGMAAQVASIAGDAVEAGDPANSPAMQAAMGMSASVAAAQLANDLVALAMGALMGKDVCVPPGTPGAITVNTSPNVQIGGFPMPSWMAIAGGLLKLVKGLKGRRGRGPRPAHHGPCATEAQPIDLTTGAFIDEVVDYEVPGPIPFVWGRFYDSRWADRDGPVGRGHRHTYQWELRQDLDGLTLVSPRGEEVPFPELTRPGEVAARDGLLLRALEVRGRYEVEQEGQPVRSFHLRPGQVAAPLAALTLGEHQLRLGYDARGHLQEIHLGSGEVLRVEVDPQGRILRLVTRPGGGRPEEAFVSYGYDQHGLLLTFTDAARASCRYRYDAAGRMVRRTDRQGYSFYNEYDGEGRCVREWGQDGLYDARVRYLPEGRCAICTYADGATTTVFHNEDGVATEVVDPHGGKTTFEVDESGRVVRECDPEGNVTRWLYNGWGEHVARIGPLGHAFPRLDVEPNPPDPLGYRLPETPLEWEYGRLVSAAGITPPGPDDPVLAPYPSSIYNRVLRLDSLAPGDGPSGDGRPRRAFDSRGRLVEEVDPEGHVQRWKYDNEGNVLEYQDRDGSVWQARYRSWNLKEQDIDPSGAITAYDYNLRAQVTKVIDPGGTVTEYVLDPWDRIAEVRRHGTVRERYRYDQADNLLEKTDGSGQPLLSLEVLPGDLMGVRQLASGERQTFKYDARGRILEAATEGVSVSFAYDPAGRQLKDLRDGVGVRHRFHAGRLVATTCFDRLEVRYESPRPGLLVITDPTGKKHRFLFSPAGLISREHPTGTTALAVYDGKGRCLQKAATRDYSDRVLWHARYRYSAEGSLLRVEEQEEEVRYEYDRAHRLRREIPGPQGFPQEYVHDVGGNLLEQPGLRDVELTEGNRLLKANGEAFTYNGRNHISRREGPQGRVLYTYDSLDRLTRCEINGSVWEAEYDPLGRRVSKTRQGRTTRYHWDDFRLAAEHNPDGGVRLYLYVDETALVPFMFVDYPSPEADPEEGRCYYLFTNQIGVPVRVEDEHGRVAWQARIDPFGSAHVDPRSRLTLSLRFPGHYHDEETGLHYNRFRYYDPVLGRYLQSDPLGLAGGLNLYAYPPQPLTVVDLDGLSRKHKMKANKGKKGKQRPGANQEVAAEAVPVKAPKSLADKYDLTPRPDTGQPILFGQRAVSPTFSKAGKFKEADINDVAAKVKSGEMSPDDLPVQYIWVNGEKVVVNNRSLTTLSKAGMKPTKAVDMSGKLPKDGPDSQESVLGRLEEMDGKPSRSIPVRSDPEDRNSPPREIVTLPED